MTEENKRCLVVFPFSFTGRTRYIIEKFFRDGFDFSGVIHLTSRWTRIEDFRTRMALSLKRPVIPPTSFSLKSFAGKIVNEKTSYRLISPVEQFLILFKLSAPVSEKIKINPVAFATVLRLFIKDFKVSHERFDFDAWFNEIDRYPWKYEDNRTPVKNALRIMGTYQDFLEKNNLADEDDLYRIAAEHLDDFHFDTVLLEGMLEFVPSQRSFIKKISERSKNFISAYQFDDGVYYDARNLILEENLGFLKSLVKTVDCIKSSGQCEEILHSFPSPDEEVRSIGEMILEAISQDSALFWEDFLVVFPDMLYYRPIVQRIFKRLEIPFCMTPGYVLSQDPSIVALVSFMEWIDYPSWERLMSLFTSPFFSFDTEEASKFSQASREIFNGIGFFPSQEWLQAWANWRKVEKTRDLMNKKSQTITRWSQSLEKSMKHLGWKMFDHEGRAALMQILSGLSDDTSSDLAMFRKIFNSVLNITEVEKSKGRGVRVMGVLDSMGVEAERIFFGGATDDCLPMAAGKEEFFLPDSLKENLKLTSYRLRIARERLDLYRLKKSGKRIVFTYPARVGSRQKNRSIMLYDLPEYSAHTVYFSGQQKNIFLPISDYDKFLQKFLKNNRFNFTVSQIDDLSRCPYMFYLKHVEKIKPYREPVIEEIPEFWGKLLHATAEKSAIDFLGKIQDDFSIETQHKKFCNLVNEFLEKPGVISGRHDYKLPTVIRTFLEKRKQFIFDAFRDVINKHRGHKIVELEAQYTIEIENMNITGKFDRIERTEEGTFEIIDYKSGKVPDLAKKYPESQNCLDLKNLELPLYALIRHKLDRRQPKVFVWVFGFEEGQKERQYSQITRDFLEMLESGLNNLADDLKNRNFQFKPRNTNNCYGCFFSDFCIMKKDISDE